ncbi:MAG: hypothetical protein SGI96_21300 [Bacteroidota bacterium]|nr:hypothetical protein [Bacteroidota bacterium]
MTSNHNKDHTLPTFGLNYPSVEFLACGERFVGVGICALKNISDLKLKILGLHKGSIIVTSTCGYNFSVMYSKTEEINIPIEKLKTCWYSFMVQVLVDGVLVHPIDGHLWVTTEDDGRTFVSKYQREYDQVIQFVADRPTIVTFIGCGIKYHKLRIPEDGNISVSTYEVNVKEKKCILFGQFDSEMVYWLLWRHEKGTSTLPEPTVKRNMFSTSVYADGSVLMIAVDNEVKFGNSVTFWFKSKWEYIRLFTTSGRVLVGKKTGDDIIWMN